MRSDGCGANRSSWALSPPDATEMRIGDMAMEDAALKLFLWGHFDLAVGYGFLTVGRVQVITTLEEVLDLAGGISGAYEPAVETTGCNGLYGQVD